MSKNADKGSSNIKGLKIIKVTFAFFSISLLLFSTNALMSSYAQPQPQKVPAQGKQLSLPQLKQQVQKQIQQQQQLLPQLQQQVQKQQPQTPKQQEEKQQLLLELQRLQQQQWLPETTEEKEREVKVEGIGEGLEETDREDDVPSYNDVWKAFPYGVVLPFKLGATTANQTSTTANQESQVQAMAAPPPPPSNPRPPRYPPLNPPPYSQPLFDDQSPIKQGCFPFPGVPTPVTPAWVVVKSYPYDTVEVHGEIVPGRFHMAHHEWPFNHQSHDFAPHIKLDPKYYGLASRANGKYPTGWKMEFEWEIGTDNSGKTDRFPKFFWPWEGDRAWMLGRWVYDCGHFNLKDLRGWKTEIHPPYAAAFTRNEPYQFPGENRPSSATVTYIYLHGRGGPALAQQQLVGGQNYEFDIPTPPKPIEDKILPGAQLMSKVTCCFGSVNVPPIVTPKSQLCDFVGYEAHPKLVPCAHVVIPLSSIPPSKDLKYGATVAVKWIDPTLVVQPAEGFRKLRVTFDSIFARIDHENEFGSGEWDNLWVGVNGKWIELSGPSGHGLGNGLHDVDNGEVIRFPPGKFVDVIVPESGELKIQTTGWEDDNDGYYGHNYAWWLALPTICPSPFSPTENLICLGNGGLSKFGGALDDNDWIGVLIKRYCANTVRSVSQMSSVTASSPTPFPQISPLPTPIPTPTPYCSPNFGIGPHSDPSNFAVGDSGTGDFYLRYRIEQLGVYPPDTGTPLPVKPKLPTPTPTPPPQTPRPPPPPDEEPLPPICKTRPWLPQCKDLM